MESKEENKFICHICLIEYFYFNNDIIYTPCIHGFHKKCIKQWLEKNKLNNIIPCPVCRFDIKELGYLVHNNKIPTNLPNNNKVIIRSFKCITGKKRIKKSVKNAFDHFNKNIEIKRKTA